MNSWSDWFLTFRTCKTSYGDVLARTAYGNIAKIKFDSRPSQCGSSYRCRSASVSSRGACSHSRGGSSLAAPSANVSGSPSPTAAAHVLHDLDGKIDAVIDGGPCTIGLESTVITLAEEAPVLLRPGAVTLEQLQQVLGTVKMADAVLHQLKQGSVAASPGMKYKHYAPKAKLILLEGSDRHFSLCECARSGRGCSLVLRWTGKTVCVFLLLHTEKRIVLRSRHSNYSMRCVNWMT